MNPPDDILARIVDGRTDLVLDYVGSGQSPSAADDQGVTLLQWCAYYGDVSAIRYLVEQGASLEELGRNLDLNGAAFHGHWRLCQFLIEQGADMNLALEATGEVPLHAALCDPNRSSAEHVVHILLAHGADPERATIPEMETGCFMRDCRTTGETPLHRAAAFGSRASLSTLIQAGARVDARDARGDTPLTWASLHRRPAFILDMLCLGPHRVHPEAVQQSLEAHDHHGDGMARHLLGRPHLQADKPKAT